MQLDKLRLELDRIDKELVALFCDRMAITQQVAEFKRENAMPVKDYQREAAIIEKNAQLAPKYAAEIAELYQTIFEVSRRQQLNMQKSFEKTNLVLTGLPGSGKSSIGYFVASRLGRQLLEIDAIVTEVEGRSPAKITAQEGEKAYREIEGKIIADAACQEGVVIVLRAESLLASQEVTDLRKNGVVVFIDREMAKLEIENRTFGEKLDDIKAVFKNRREACVHICDAVLKNDKSIEDAVKLVLATFKKLTGAEIDGMSKA